MFIWLFAGIFFNGAKIFVAKKMDFSEYPIAEGRVIGSYDYNGKRWMVEFTGPDGKSNWRRSYLL